MPGGHKVDDGAIVGEPGAGVGFSDGASVGDDRALHIEAPVLEVVPDGQDRHVDIPMAFE